MRQIIEQQEGPNNEFRTNKLKGQICKKKLYYIYHNKLFSYVIEQPLSNNLLENNGRVDDRFG